MEKISGSGPRGRSGRAWLVPLMLFVALSFIYGLTISHARLSFDVYGANWTSWHLAATGNPWIDGVKIPYLESNHEQPIKVLIVSTPDGHTLFGRFPGVVVASLPMYLLFGGGMSTTPGGLTAALMTAATVTLLFLALRRHMTTRDAVLAASAFGLATPVWSVAANGMWPHTVTIFGIAGMAWASTTKRWWLVGVFGGVALWGRLHAAIIVAVLGVLVGWQRRKLGPVIRIAVASLVFLLGYGIWTRLIYGTENPAGVYGASTSEIVEGGHRYWFDLPNQLGMWIAPDRGILVWTPIIVVLLPALARSWRSVPDWSRSLLIGGLAYTIVESALNTFTGGDAFYGYRYGLEMLACATPALAISATAMGPIARRALGPVLSVQLLAITLGATSDYLYLLEDTVWRKNAFVHAIDRIGPAGWFLVALFAVGGSLAGSWWGRSTHEMRLGASSNSPSTGSPV